MKLISCLFVLLIADKSLGNLYNETDPMAILDYKNFRPEVFDKPHAWVIEFYLEWCGHCINFASIWREFAWEISGI